MCVCVCVCVCVCDETGMVGGVFGSVGCRDPHDPLTWGPQNPLEMLSGNLGLNFRRSKLLNKRSKNLLSHNIFYSSFFQNRKLKGVFVCVCVFVCVSDTDVETSPSVALQRLSVRQTGCAAKTLVGDLEAFKLQPKGNFPKD